MNVLLSKEEPHAKSAKLKKRKARSEQLSVFPISFEERACPVKREG